MNDKARFLPAGDKALVVELGDSISPELNRKVHDLVTAIESRGTTGVTDLVPTYRSLLVQYDPLQTSTLQLQASLSEIEQGLSEGTPIIPRIVHIPTLYGDEHGPDLELVAEGAGLSTEEVISVHAGTDYLVYMMGFTPGFPYLGGLSEALATPRLSTPRVETPAGSVGIAESQTGVYPAASPGGWRLIGRTPLSLFDPGREPPALLAAGDYVRFVPLSAKAEYDSIHDLVQKGRYEVTEETYK